ncbi:MAG: Protein of unknown function DUF1592, partial [uncultured Phycisphaerae bacterium]
GPVQAAARPGGARGAGAAAAEGPAVDRAGRELRRPVAGAAEPGRPQARPVGLPGVRRQAAGRDEAGDRAVLRPRDPRGPQRPGAADGRLHVRERPAGQALRHGERGRRPVPQGEPGRDEAGRVPDAGERAGGDGHADADQPREARQVRAGERAGHPAAPAAAGRVVAERGREGRLQGQPEGPAGGAPQGPELRGLPREDGRDRVRAGELRRHRPVAGPRRQIPGRLDRPTARRHRAQGGRRAAGDARAAAERVRRLPGPQDAHLRLGPRAGVLRPMHGQGHRGGGEAGRLPVLVRRPGGGAERAVPEAPPAPPRRGPDPAGQGAGPAREAGAGAEPQCVGQGL